MASTDVEICNIALSRIGQRQWISALDEDTTEAQACNTLYGHCRDVVLGRVWWPFATGRAELAVTAETRLNWEYVYDLPSDLIAARYLALEGYQQPRPDQQYAFSVEHDATFGRVLLTDVEDALLVYTKQVTSVALFPPLFTDALAWKLAAELALVVPVKPQLAMALEQRFERELALAAAHDFRQAKGGAEPEGSYIRVR